MTKDTRRKITAKESAMASWLMVMLLSLFMICSDQAHAQLQSPDQSALVLTAPQKTYFLGPHLFVTEDAAQKITRFDDIAEQHENNQRGIRQNKKFINLGHQGHPHWLVFNVLNKTQQTNWILDFGQHSEGRFGLVNQIYVYDRTNKAEILNALAQKENQKSSRQNLHGTSIPIELKTNQEILVIIYALPEAGIPTTLPLTLKTAHNFIQAQNSLFNMASFFRLFLISMAFFFLAITVMRKNWSYIAFIAYYAMLALFFHWYNGTILSGFGAGSEIFTILVSLYFISGLVITKAFLEIDFQHYKENYIIFSLCGLLVLSNILLFFIPLNEIFIRSLTIFGPTCLSLFFILVLSFIQSKDGQSGGFPFLFGWISLSIGLAVSLASAMHIFEPTSFVINAFWYSIIPQSIFFILGTVKKFEALEQLEKEIASRQNKEERSIARLRQSKESSDQARLLRVIEREREVMAELREREAERTEEMRIAKDVADEANRAKSAFLAVVSHEIRTPMTGIMGMVRLLLDSGLNKDQKDFAKTIQDSGEAMLALLNDILDFEKIERGKMDIEIIDFDLHRLLQGVKMLMSGHAAQKNLSLEINADDNLPRFVKGDPTRLRQVLLNLTGNAIKFTSSGQITIHVRITRTDKMDNDQQPTHEIYFAVQDSGIGISQDVQKNLFSPFSQADSSISRKFGGSGLGLAICKGLIEAMGSNINVSSREGEGSIFFFSLTMEESNQESGEKKQTDTASDSIAPMRILIVDDNEINRKVILGFLEKTPHDTESAVSAEEAIEKIQKDEFDIIFMDVELPGMRGDEATKTIRNMPDPKYQNLPIIALTGNVMDDDIKGFYEAGMNGFVAKPIKPEDLHKALNDAAEKNHQSTPEDTVENNETDQTQPDKNHDDALREAGIEPGLSPEEIQKRMNIGAEDLDKDTFSEAIETFQERKNNADSAPVFDENTLGTLKDTLGKDQLEELITGAIDKSVEIIAALEEALANNDISEIAARAHELKGMAGNFGLLEISDIAGDAEIRAKNGETDGLSELITRLPDANENARSALTEWMHS